MIELIKSCKALCAIFVLSVVALGVLNVVEAEAERAYRAEIIAAINDKGCNPHKQLHIEQKNIQIKDTYVKWNK